MDSSYKTADLGGTCIIKPGALSDTIPLNTVKSQRSVFLLLKTG